MDRQALSSGFSLIEMMIVLLVVLILSSLSIRPIDLQLTKVQDFQSLYLHTQTIALLTHSDLELDTDIITDYPIRFKANGNTTMGQTFQIGKRSLIIMIGTGRIHEKSLYDD